jgi:hypothetical protein
VPQRTRKTMGGAHKEKGRLRCHKRPKSREETPKEGSDSGVGLGGRYRTPLPKTIAISGSIERKGSRTDTKVYGARPQGRALPQWVDTVEKVENRTTLKSRESQCLDVSIAAMLARADTKVRGRFCAKRCGPSRRRVRNASVSPLRYLHDCSDCFRLERSPGGSCTHWKAPPCHGARQ